MRLLDLLETTQLLEIRLIGNGRIEDGALVVAFKDKYAIFNDPKTKKENDFMTLHEIIEPVNPELSDTIHIITRSNKMALEDFIVAAMNKYFDEKLLRFILGTIQDGYLDIHTQLLNSLKIFGFSKRFDQDPEIRKLVKQLGLKGIKIRDETIDLDDTRTGKIDLPEYLYHGTSTEKLESILKKGLLPGKSESNWEGVDLSNKLIFGTTSLEDAKNHAIRTAKRDGSEPVIIQFRIPDKNKLFPDFDTALILGDKETAMKLDYDVQPWWADRDLPNDIRKAWKVGKHFAYKGRIPPSMISVVS